MWRAFFEFIYMNAQTPFYKAIVFISSLSLLFQSITPAVTLPLLFANPAYAQEATQSSESVVTPTEAPQPEADRPLDETSAITEEVTPTPEITTTPTESPTPTEEVTPGPTSTEPPHETSPPDQQGEILDGASIEVTPTENPTATPTPVVSESENGNLSATVLSNVEAASLDLDSVDPSSSGTITTDKADYAPTDTAIISGADFKANHTYSLTISSTDEPATSTTVSITTDESGAFLYAYQLDGNYRPDYTVVVKDGNKVVATTTFTDSQVLNSATLNGVSAVSVASSASINAVINVTTTGSGAGARWRSTGWRISNTPGAFTCVDHPNHDSAGSYSETFSITAPAVSGVYNAYFIEYNADGCSGGDASSLILTNGVTVTGSPTPTPTLTPTPTPGGGGGNASATLSQYANDAPVGWVNGNLGASKATYYEGNTIPYRMAMDNLTLASHTLTFEWDTTKSDKHAEDYLNSFDATVGSADPCDGVAGCLIGSPNTFAIPADPQVTGAGITPPAGLFKMYGGTITGVSAYSYANGSGFVGDKSARVSVTFTASVTNPVLAWGGHIAHRSDWGIDNSAISIPGSPYHMRLVDLDGSGGNQDRSLSADAVIFPASITVIKQANVEGSTSFSFTGSPAPLSNFSLVDDGTSANTHLFGNIINFTTYQIAETVPAGWALNSIVCNVTSANGGTQNVSNPGVSIGLHEGENVTCTYTNTIQSAHLTLVKTLTKDNGGTAVETDWTLTASGSATISGSTGAAAVTNAEVNAGIFTLSESGPTGYTAGNWSCVGGTQNGNQITLTAGQSATCTINNNDNAPSLTLNKILVNDNGGTAVESNWTLTATGPTSISGPGATGSADVVSDATFDAGVYTLSESAGPSGYTPTAWSCVGGTQNGNQITVGLGQSVVCSITNNDNAPSLTLVKTVTNDNGGTAVAANWTLTADGPTDISGPGGATSSASFDAGTYALSESAGPSGYLAGDWSCIGGTQNGASITVALGQSATCTINNNDVAPQLTVIKHVINDDGGVLAAGNFTMNVTGTNVSDDSFSGSESGTTVTLNAGSYSVDEATVSGYTKTLGANCTGSIALGQTKTCTVTNDDQAAHIIVIKHVVTDNGGTADANDFTMTINGVTTVGANSFAGAENPGTNKTLSTVGNYSVTEDGLTGYAASYSADCTGSIALGQTKTCTITNDDIQPKLTVTKVVTTDNGGTKVVSDFPLFVDNTSVTSGVQNGFNAGSYTVHESSQSGYVGTITGDCLANGSVTLLAGDVKACTITNDDQPATLIVKKVVINDNGGTASVSAFSFEVNEGDAIDFEADGQNNLTVDAGVYTIVEPDVDGYTTSYDNCSRVTIPNGGTATCTITNDDDAPSLTLVKHVTNDHGGQASASAWTLTADGPTDISGPGGVVSGASFDAGTYALSESAGPDGYTAGTWSCNGGTFANDQVTLGLGESATCEITNNDDVATLIVIKHVENNNIGDKNASDFTMNVTGTDVSDDSFPGDELGTTITLDAGEYEVTENTVTGYSDTYSANCAGTIANGQTKTCTITNSRDTGTITVNKVLSPENDPGRFNLQIGGVTTGSGENVGDGGTTGTITYGTGDYTVGEVAGTDTNLDDYSTSFVCTDGEQGITRGTGTSYDELTLGKNQDIVCTFTNTRKTGDLKVNKLADTDGDGDYDSFNTKDFSWGTVAGVTTNDMGDSVTFNTGEYDVYESSKAGYLFTGWYYGNARENDFSCTNLPENDEAHNYHVLPTNIDVAFDQTTELTLCNQFQHPILTITKSNNAAGDKHPGENVLFTLTVTATQSAVSNVTVTDLPAGGFVVRDNTWTANSSVRGDILSLTGNPNYHSPGVWNLGDMIVDEVVTLSYIADISGSEEPGLYKDTAWAKGKDLADNTVYANTDSDPTYFVGTQVNVVTDTQFSSSHNVINETTGEVLGASTELPSTGANTLWLMIAAFLVASGISMGAVGWLLRRKYE